MNVQKIFLIGFAFVAVVAAITLGLAIAALVKANKSSTSTVSPTVTSSLMPTTAKVLREQRPDDWYRILSDAGISIVSSGNCFDRTIPTCTSVDGMTKVTVNTLIALKKESGCTITLTGGTEVGHKNVSFGSIKYTHANGYKADISQSACLNSYVARNYQEVGQVSMGPVFKNTKNGDIFYKAVHLNQQGRHWDITANDGSHEFARLQIPSS